MSMSAHSQSHTGRPAHSLPSGAWDSHMHVCDPIKFPLDSAAKYQPHTATLEQAHSTITDQLGIPNLVFVQPSPYGNDNTCLLHALKITGRENGRGVVVFDPKKTELSQLKEWHAMGVRGVRVNLKSVKKVMAPEEFRTTIKAYAEAIRPMETWVLQLYVDMAMITHVESLMPQLGVKVVIDHLGSPKEGEIMPADRLSEMEGWDSLMNFMKNDKAFVKISGPYRLSTDPQYRDLEPLAKALFAVRQGKGVVFASDWPHTRFETVDIAPWVDRCVEWCGRDKELLEALFRTNAEELWDVSR